jgi:hypothetical protein
LHGNDGRVRRNGEHPGEPREIQHSLQDAHGIAADRILDAGSKSNGLSPGRLVILGRFLIAARCECSLPPRLIRLHEVRRGVARRGDQSVTICEEELCEVRIIPHPLQEAIDAFVGPEHSAVLVLGFEFGGWCTIQPHDLRLITSRPRVIDNRRCRGEERDRRLSFSQKEVDRCCGPPRRSGDRAVGCALELLRSDAIGNERRGGDG